MASLTVKKLKAKKLRRETHIKIAGHENAPLLTIDTIARKMNTSKSNAGRLVMTEQAFFSKVAQHDAFLLWMVTNQDCRKRIHVVKSIP